MKHTWIVNTTNKDKKACEKNKLMKKESKDAKPTDWCDGNSNSWAIEKEVMATTNLLGCDIYARCQNNNPAEAEE